MSDFVCLYQGYPTDCQECGGYKEPDLPFCCTDCEASWAERCEAGDSAQRERRAREDAFGEKAAELVAAGYSYEEVDVLLAHMPT